MKFQTGDKVADFTTTAHFQDGSSRPWTLSEELRKGSVLLVFYPGDFTSVCTKQLCDYRDNWQRLNRFKAQVAGISTNDAASHDRFAAAMRLPFPLLDDPTRGIARDCGMLMVIGMTARGFVLVGTSGRATLVFREKLPFFRRTAAQLEDLLHAHLAG